MCRDEPFHETMADAEPGSDRDRGDGPGWAWSPVDRAAGLVADLDLAGIQALWRAKHRAGALPRRADFGLAELAPWLGRVCFVHPGCDGEDMVEIAGCELLSTTGEPVVLRLPGAAPFPPEVGDEAPYAVVRRRRVGMFARGAEPIDWRGIILPLAGDVLMVCFLADRR